MTDPKNPDVQSTSRRRFMVAAAATGAFLGVGGTAYAQQGERVTYRLIARAGGWEGVEPEDIAGETNPTLDVRVGNQYTVEYENADGLPHNFQILDDAGSVLMKSGDANTEDQKLDFEGQEGMETYNCLVHPTSMQGDVNLMGSSGSDDSTDTPEGTETDTPEGTETDTPDGTDDGAVDFCATEFHADLSGDNQVPDRVDTDAMGEAMFTFADHGAGPHLHYTLSLSNTENVTAAHIHQGAEGENGPVVVGLFESETPVDCTDGTISQGKLVADDLGGPMAGMSLADLAQAMCDGQTYVNVHTEANPAGEIRGQVVAKSE